jgi:hypothetical protein
MVLHLPPDEGGFGVTFNDVTTDDVFYTTTSRFVVWFGSFSQERQNLSLPKDDLQDSDSWSSSPRVILRDIHSHLIVNCYCKDTVTPPSKPGARARVGRSQQDGDAQQQEDNPLLLLQGTRLHEVYHVWGGRFQHDQHPLSTPGDHTDP